MKRALDDAFNMKVQRKKGMMEQRPKTVKLKVQQMEQLIFLQSMKQQGVPGVRTAGSHAEYKMEEIDQFREGAKRWCVDESGMNLICKQLVRVDNSLLWADVIGQEEMMVVEANEDLMVIPADSKQEQTVLCSLEEDGVNNNVKSPV